VTSKVKQSAVIFDLEGS